MEAQTTRILIIDDEIPISQLLQEALEGEGYTVDTACNGSEGVARSRSEHYDLVLTDLSMPDMSGWDVIEKILSHAPQTPIILVTGWGAELDQERVETSGCRAVVQKPFEILELFATAERILAQTRRPAPVV